MPDEVWKPAACPRVILGVGLEQGEEGEQGQGEGRAPMETLSPGMRFEPRYRATSDGGWLRMEANWFLCWKGYWISPQVAWAVEFSIVHEYRRNVWKTRRVFSSTNKELAGWTTEDASHGPLGVWQEHEGTSLTEQAIWDALDELIETWRAHETSAEFSLWGIWIGPFQRTVLNTLSSLLGFNSASSYGT